MPEKLDVPKAKTYRFEIVKPGKDEIREIATCVGTDPDKMKRNLAIGFRKKHDLGPNVTVFVFPASD